MPSSSLHAVSYLRFQVTLVSLAFVSFLSGCRGEDASAAFANIIDCPKPISDCIGASASAGASIAAAANIRPAVASGGGGHFMRLLRSVKAKTLEGPDWRLVVFGAA